MDLSAARDALVQEARELLGSMEAALLEVEAGGATPDRLNAIFRTAHTIKGSAGLFALDLIVDFTHVMENVLERARNHSLPLDSALVSTLLRCGDYLGQLVDAIQAGTEAEDPDPLTRERLLDALRGTLGEAAPASPPSGVPQMAEVRIERDEGGPLVQNEYWHISLRFGHDVLRLGLDPISFLQYLESLGRIVHLYTLYDELPVAAEMDPEACYLGFEIDFDSEADKQAIERVFEFVQDDCRVRILPPRARITEYIDLISSLPESRQRLGEILLAGGSLTQHELTEALRLQREAQGESGSLPRLGELLIEEQMVQAPVVAAALAKQKQTEERRGGEHRVIKVEAAKLDQLINLVGELVIANAGARLAAERNFNALLRNMPGGQAGDGARKQQRAERARHGVLMAALGEVNQLVEQIRDRALNMRMIPIGEVFQRFPRVVRDVSQELGKRIELVITGAETELDKSMVEKLSDPLMHIVRNAIDHGIESTEQRLATGKPEQGRVTLNAYHESGCIVIEVGDDGRGLDTRRIRAKALERGLIDEDAQLTEAEIHQLIFAPGFSTAETVTNLSGRGVGMDVVKRGIEALRGEIELISQPGQGTTMRIRLPLTLAIIDGFQVSVGDAVFVLPLDMVVECADMVPPTGGQSIVNLRGEPLPYVRLRQAFDLAAPPPASSLRESLVIVEYGHQRAGIVVDRLLGEVQAVIKPMGQIFRGVRGVGGSTILGDGRVALILDIPALIALSNETQEPAALRGLLN